MKSIKLRRGLTLKMLILSLPLMECQHVTCPKWDKLLKLMDLVDDGKYAALVNATSNDPLIIYEVPLPGMCCWRWIAIGHPALIWYGSVGAHDMFAFV